MDHQQRENLATKGRRSSLRSVLFGALFIIAFVLAVFVDIIGVLQYFNLISGWPLTTLEMGAGITSANVVPLLLMGMSISLDMNQNE